MTQAELLDVQEIVWMRKHLQYQGYEQARLLPTGEWAGLRTQVYCVSLCVGMKPGNAWSAMFSFDDWTSAEAALAAWDGQNFPPGYVPTVPLNG